MQNGFLVTIIYVKMSPVKGFYLEIGPSFVLRGSLIFSLLIGIRFDQNTIDGIDDPGCFVFLNGSRIFPWARGPHAW